MSDSVKFILRGSDALAPSEFRHDVLLHVLVFPLIAAGGLGVLWYNRTRRRVPADDSELDQPDTVPDRVEVNA